MTSPHPAADEKIRPAVPKTVVLVGLMGAGKSAVGRRLAVALDLPFIDADAEIELAAGRTIAEIFESHGEPAFRDGERRVIERLLKEKRCVLSTGGGAFMDPRTRKLIAKHGISIWLRADLEVLLARTGRRSDRPLLNDGDPRVTLMRLMEERNPIYAQADIAVDSSEGSVDETARRVLAALRDRLNTGEA